MVDFHANHFDDGTKLKLELFRGYIREWLGVFLAKRSYPEIHIYDLFCGPGTDLAGHPGSPMLVLEELEAYFVNPKVVPPEDVEIFVHFNDIKKSNIDNLAEAVEGRENKSRCNVRYTSLDFAEAFQKAQPSLKRADTANLLILDQCGIKAITEHIFTDIVDCPTTDMLFFVSSSILRRFANESAIQRYLPFDAQELASIEHKKIHRFVCHNLYRKLIPEGISYYLAPFSIEKGDGGSNIYGVIFGSSHLLGLDKFLNVCWNEDQVTGEANYNIDGDIIWTGQAALFPEDNIIRKVDDFKQALLKLISDESPTNHEVYTFSLENGFDARRSRNLLSELQNMHQIRVVDLNNNTEARKGAFYVNWDGWKNPPRVRFKAVR